jgi:predicted RNA binding protein YcfA (HicA-like mRNA interferase family)
MSKTNKLRDRFLSIPADYTWDELIKVLTSYGYKKISSGKTGGSRRKFVNEDGDILSLHEPHPSKIVKKYALRQVIDNLKEKGKITDD